MTKPVLRREDITPCALCGKGVMHTGLPLAWRFTVERISIDARAVRTQAGLETMIGNVAIAHVLSPVGDFGIELMKPVTLLVCESCANDLPIVAAAMENAERDIRGEANHG